MRLLALMLIAGCMHELPVRPVEHCAMQGMVLGGTSSKLGDDDPTLNCRRVEKPAESCEVNAALKSLAARSDYGTAGRNTLLFFTYAFFIVPGVLVHWGLNGERDEIAADDDKVFQDALASCR